VRAIVTGAGGFAGGWLVRHLTASGDEVRGVRHDELDVRDTEAVRALIATAETRVLEAHANHQPGDTGPRSRLHSAEQDLLLVRLPADTGARRGELAALRLTDLDRRVLTIERALSAGRLTRPKSGRARTLTVGATTSPAASSRSPQVTLGSKVFGPGAS